MKDFESEHTVDPIRQIKRWFETAVPRPGIRNLHTQLGVHLEEVGEMITELQQAAITPRSEEELQFAGSVLDFTQRKLKEQKPDPALDLSRIDRVRLLDSLCDQIVTAVGVAHMLGLDIEGALGEVARSNDSKFGPDGKPIFNEQLKIVKGPGYFAPALEKYV